jgi:pantothenate kinase
MKTGSAAPQPEHTSPPAVERLLGLLALGKPRVLVALAGLPGAGKSTWATRWAEAVTRRAGAGQMQVLGMDGFHLPRAALAKLPDPAQALARRGAPWTFDAAALRERLLALRQGSQVAVPWPDFQHDIGDPVDGVFSVPAATRLVLVEGLYLLHRQDGWDLQGLFDETWFLDMAPAQARRQLAERHQRVWGLSRADAEARIDANDGLNAELVWADRGHADWLAPGG